MMNMIGYIAGLSVIAVVTGIFLFAVVAAFCDNCGEKCCGFFR